MPPKTNGVHAEQVLMTPKQASEYTGKTKKVIEKALSNPNYAEIFSESTVKRTEYPGYPAIIQIEKTALDSWLAALPVPHRGGEGSRKARSDEGRRYTLRMRDSDKDALIAALNGTGLVYTLETGYKPRSKKGSATGANSAAPAPTPEFEHNAEEVVSA